MRRLISALTALLLANYLAACQPRALSVADPWARPASAGSNGAVYFVIDNPTNQADRLLSASSNIAEHVELHISVMDEQGTMGMHHQEEGVEVPARTKVAFEPGGLHVMLVDLPQDLQEGDNFPLTLTFQNAGEIQLDVTVKESGD